MQPDIQRLRLKVNSSKSHLVRDWDVRFAEPRPLPFLRGGMIHFEDVQPRGLQRITVGERVQPRAQHDVLPNAAFYSPGELVFGVTAADGDEGSQGAREGRLRFVRIIGTGDGDGQWILEHPGRVQQLVRRAPDGDTLGGPAGLCFLHEQ